jgi:predicted aminopeptidase
MTGSVIKLAVVLLALVTSACSTLGYYSQSISGHLNVMQRRQPIEDLLDSGTISPELKARLSAAQSIRRFASTVLGLPDNGSFTRYADLERPYAVWNVFAAPELSLELNEWCYPFAGCVTYRGYFSEDKARALAGQLRAQGFDTYYGGVAAYSTLGWFDDPLLNTVTGYRDTQLAGLIFHELAHQQLYVPGDTLFNEGFATVVEHAGVRRWLEEQADPVMTSDYAAHRRHHEAFHALVARTRAQLEEVYAGELLDSDKRRLKKQYLDAMRAEYARQRRSGDMDSNYDAWFAGELNNARLGAVNAYRAYVPLFEDLFANCGGDFSVFYQRAAAIGAVPGPQRLVHLRQAAAAVGVVGDQEGVPSQD